MKTSHPTAPAPSAPAPRVAQKATAEPAPEPRAKAAHLLTYKETAALCGISRMTLWRWRTQGGLPFIRGRIAPAQLARWLIQREGLDRARE